MTLAPEEFAQLTLEDAARGLAEKRFTSADLVEASLARMEQFEPAINAVITANPDEARRQAAAFDADPSARANKPLAGLPLLFKDNLMTRGLRTTCGSKILDNFVPPYDATAIHKVYAAGGICVAKANMDEFAMGNAGETSAYGPTRNPWDTERVPGGSSSGSAAAVAYGGGLASLGSDTGGSIRQPAAFNGLVGIKPTYGRVSRYGAGALASSLDQIGAITKTVRDNALMLDIITGHDPLDSTSLSLADSAPACLPTVESGIKGLRLGYDPSIRDREGFSPTTAAALDNAMRIAKEAGAEVKEVTVPLVNYGVAAYYIICCCEASTNLARFDGVRYGVRKDGANVWDVYCNTRGDGFGDEVKRRIMMGSYALSKGYYDAYYLKAARVRRLFTLEFNKLFEQVDGILMPVTPQPPRKLGADESVLESYLVDIFTLPANLTSLPSLAFPLGVADGLPVGAQIMGRSFGEDILYRFARTIEQSVEMPGAPWTRTSPETHA
ncbi:MAG: Asp-tRNA(Asn)/Glu-tRNA(Gln) amidotransferase subunit GatA [Planctomycetes bacterium]|nr:Asp-tRNA(Asn)/Glu-tRNA(Gln) amidotransferase subunit GatA [Planctomycetota bacterium]